MGGGAPERAGGAVGTRDIFAGGYVGPMNARDRARRRHWESVWASRADDELSWFQAEPTVSLGWIERIAGIDDPIVDIGGGHSPLAATLARRGYRDLTVIDVSRHAVERAQRRAGRVAPRIHWSVGDVTRLGPVGPVAVWHDRAVFHFLTRAEERERYLRRARAAVRPGGYFLLATFAPDGPPRCSGLPVRRYDAPSLARELGEGVRLVAHRRESHRTPFGTRQPFLYTLWRRTDAATRRRPSAASAPGSPSGRSQGRGRGR